MYRVQLANFEGPLDLLLFFIQRDELNIYDIPISYITEQYFDTLQLMEELDLDVASEFIYMASLLMSIKARMMLPRDEELWEEVPLEDDPRFELVQRLLEYKRYREMAVKLDELGEDARQRRPRGRALADQVDVDETGEALRDVTLFDLMAAYRKVLAKVQDRAITHTVEVASVTLEQQTVYILDTLQEKGRTSFVDLCAMFTTRLQIVTTFLAALEMIREQQIVLLLEDDPLDFHLDLQPIGNLYGGASAQTPDSN